VVCNTPICAVVADLHRRTDYLVRVQALTVNGSGPATQWIPVQTFANDLDGITDFCFVNFKLSLLAFIVNTVVVVAAVTMAGTWVPSAIELVQKVDNRITRVNEDTRETTFQRLSI